MEASIWMGQIYWCKYPGDDNLSVSREYKKTYFLYHPIHLYYGETIASNIQNQLMEATYISKCQMMNKTKSKYLVIYAYSHLKQQEVEPYKYKNP